MLQSSPHALLQYLMLLSQDLTSLESLQLPERPPCIPYRASPDEDERIRNLRSEYRAAEEPLQRLYKSVQDYGELALEQFQGILSDYDALLDNPLRLRLLEARGAVQIVHGLLSNSSSYRGPVIGQPIGQPIGRLHYEGKLNTQENVDHWDRHVTQVHQAVELVKQWQYSMAKQASLCGAVSRGRISAGEPSDKENDEVGNLMEPTDKQRRFAVALSFPGEQREYVRQVDTALCKHFGADRVFYDQRFTALLARPNLDTYLQDIYHKQAELVVIFDCADYAQKQWCGLEWRAIKDLIKQRREKEIMFFRFDDAEIPGLFSIDGYVDARTHTREEAADLICERYASLPLRTDLAR